MFHPLDLAQGGPCLLELVPEARDLQIRGRGVRGVTHRFDRARLNASSAPATTTPTASAIVNGIIIPSPA
jgi:hypothetical protein